MQPYFLPYIGYYSLIKHTDEFVIFDPVQFIRHGWIERNRILKQSGGWQYIQVPLIKNEGHATLIKDVCINNAEPWKKKILSQLEHYKKKAPYYYKVVRMLNEIFADEYNSITQLNKKALQVTCNYLDIYREFPVFSEMNIVIEPVGAADEWALNICKSMGCCEYINPIGGMEFFDRSKYEQAGVQIEFQRMEISEYGQGMETFEPGLSIVDVMMFNSPEEINQMLNRYTLL